jgi:hypothetical protein
MRGRHARFGLLAGCATVLAAGAADALSWSRQGCDAFRRSALDHDAFVRATVVRTWDHRASEEQRSAEVETRVKETILGRLPRGMSMVFTATESEIGGMPFGFIPAEGVETVLFVDRDADRRWVVKSAMTADEYDRDWVPRCAF